MQGAGAVLQSDFELVVDDSHGRFGVDTFGAGLLGIESLQRGRGSMRFPPWAAEPDALPCSSFVTRRRVRRAGGTARQRLACSLTYIVIASRMTSAARRPWAAANASTCSLTARGSRTCRRGDSSPGLACGSRLGRPAWARARSARPASAAAAPLRAVFEFSGRVISCSAQSAASS
uniref:Uncharacterized protein n=2 Tax=Rhodococcus hoagii TaxID=43767 RepID=Q9EY89_RHOHA|nr:hypothetical protein [Prescottella equi]